MPKFQVEINYYKKETGKWYTDHSEELEADNLWEAQKKVKNMFIGTQPWPGLTTHGTMYVTAMVTNVNTGATMTWIIDPWRYRD
jgi:hypothetical protein